MLGNLLSIIREKKGLSKTNIADATGINVGHLTHIEKGERNPSQKALKDICQALDIPYQPISYTYDKVLTEEQKKFNLISAVPYNTIPLVSHIDNMVSCPSSIPNASMAFIMKDDTMKSSVPKGSLVYVELNTIPLNKELGLVKYNNELLIRRFAYRKNKLILKSDNLLTKDIVIENGLQLTIIGKIYVEN